MSNEYDGRESYESNLIVIRFKDLIENYDLSSQIEAAFGATGNGILAVSEIPRFCEMRSALLPIARRLGRLSDSAKAKIEDPDSKFSFGWSHGKEKLEGGKKDTLKGSFYANPIHDHPTDDTELLQRYPSYCRPNLWPAEDIPELEKAFKDLGKLLSDVGMLIIQHCDKYAHSKNPHFCQGRLQSSLSASKCFKGRLLHYFPPSSASNHGSKSQDSTDLSPSNWCGWHTDHGSLTALTPPLYAYETQELGTDRAEIQSKNMDAGLYVRTRPGKVVKVSLPADMAAFQVGQTLQVHSGGLLRATPHCVLSPAMDRQAQNGAPAEISRSTFALFMQPQWDEPMDLPAGTDPSSVGVEAWEAGMDFGQFSEKIFAEHY